MSKLAVISSFIAVLLFSIGYWICKFAYPHAFDDENYQPALNSFTDLRYSIYSVVFGLCMFCLLNISSNKWMVCFASVGFGLSVSDLVDRFVCGVTTFQYTDKIIIIFTIVLAIYKLIPKLKDGNDKTYSNS